MRAISNIRKRFFLSFVVLGLALVPANSVGAGAGAIQLSGRFGEFDKATYTIGAASSLFVEAQSRSGVRNVTFHDRDEAVQVFENGAVSIDRGYHLKHLKSLEWLLVSSPQRSGSYLPTGGWPLDVTVEGGRIKRAIIHAATNEYFAADAYANLEGRTIVTGWMLDRVAYKFDSARFVAEDSIKRPIVRKEWSWQSASSRWSTRRVDFQGRPSVPAQVNGFAAQCILDTGASGLVVSAADVSRYHIAIIGKAVAAPLVGSTISEGYARVTFAVGPAIMKEAIVHVSPNVPAGVTLCGYDFLAAFDVTIATDSIAISNEISTDPCDAGCVMVDTWNRSAIGPIRLPPLVIDRTNFDTGFASALILAPYMVPPSGRGVAPCEDVPEVTVGRLSLGAASACYEPLRDRKIEAVVGSGLLLRANLHLALGQQRIWLTPHT